MALSYIRFLFGFLLLSVIAWVVFIFVARLLAWILSWTMGASVGFRVAGWNCLRDVVMKFKKGSVESVSVGEIKLSIRQSPVKLGVGFISRGLKLQLLICDLEIVVRSSGGSSKKARTRTRTRKPRSAGKGKWMIVTNMARCLSVSIVELSVKTPRASIEVKDFRVDLSKDDGSKPTLSFKLHFLPLVIHMGESRLSYDQSSNYSQEGCISAAQTSYTMMERASAPFVCEEFSLSCEFGHDREVGVVIRNLDIKSGEVIMNLNEELFPKKRTPEDFPQADVGGKTTLDYGMDKKLQKKQNVLISLKKYTSMFPEKVSFSLPKLEVKFEHRGQDLVVENNVMGIHLRSSKSVSNEDMGESTRFDVQMDFSEIHLLGEGGTSILEILKVAIVSSVCISAQMTEAVRAEIDIKLGGTQCNVIMSRLNPWIRLHLSKKKKMVLRDETSYLERPKSSEITAIMWTCTVSAPEMTIVLYSITGSPLYRGRSQSSHVFANNIASTGIAVHTELGELILHMDYEYRECLKESLFGVETNSGSLVHIAKVSLDWGKKDTESVDEKGPNKCKLVLSVDVSGMGVYLSFQRIESIILTAMSFQTLFKSLSSRKRTAHNRVGRSDKPSGKGTHLLKLKLEHCSLDFCGDVSVENTVVADPKRVNYGSQGGRVTISVSADGTPRRANILSTLSEECKYLKYSLNLDIVHLSLTVNKEKHTTQMELERARSIYHEYLEERRPVAKVTLFDMQNAKFVHRSGGVSEIAVCSLFSATDISVRWEPDVHLSLFELMLRLKLLVHNQKLQGINNTINEETNIRKDVKPEIEATVDSVQFDKELKKRETVFAIDVETLTIAAEVGDGVDAMVQVQSIFSENAMIGILFEGLMLSFNEAIVFKSSRMQISRIPRASNSPSDGKVPVVTTWDLVVQGLDVQICMPYRLQLRAIEDSVEDMMRGLKLITNAKTNLIYPIKKESSKPKKSSSSKFGCVKFFIRKLKADIEEEPMQGWLDEHYQMRKTEACELAVRLKFLDDLVCEGFQCSGSTDQNESSAERKFYHDGVEINLQDSSAIQKLQDEIHKQAFQSYYQACQKLLPSEGSGACKKCFQAGFKPSTARTSLLSVSATELDVTLMKIEGGDPGMIENIKKLDPIALENDVPFSRLLGTNIVLHTGSLVVQLRNYTFPLLSATSGKCEGLVILAQQATSFQPQIQQDVFIGRWRKVRMLRSASGTTPPMKTYLDLPLYFQKGEVSFGVGFEPAFADISYAFTVALRRANLSVRSVDSNVRIPNASDTSQSTNINLSDSQPPKKERSLPWWDEIRNYIHGKNSLCFSETRWNVLATTDPYEKLDKAQIVSGYIEIQQSDGRVYMSARDFKVFLSSLESLVNNDILKLHNHVMPVAFLEVPVFTLEVNMDWDCESGNPLNHYLYALPSEGEPRKKVYDPFRSTSLSLRWDLSLRPSLTACDEKMASSTREDGGLPDGAVCRALYNSEDALIGAPTVNVGPHDFAWLYRFCNLNYIPPHKLRYFSRWPRFGVPRVARSGNLSLDRVMTEFMLRLDATPTCIKHVALQDDDPASGLTFSMTKLKHEIYCGRGRQKYTFDCKRDPLDPVYQGIDLHMPKAYLNKGGRTCVGNELKVAKGDSKSASTDRASLEKCNHMGACTEKHRDDGFLLSSEYFTIRKQAPKADPERLLAWQEAGRRNLEMTSVRSQSEKGSEGDDCARSDHSDDDGFNVVIADNCLRVFVYGLKLLWTIENRNAVWSWVGGISKAFEPSKPSPSRQYAQRKMLEENQVNHGTEKLQDDIPKPSPAISQGTTSPTPQQVESSGSIPSPSHSVKKEGSSSGAVAKNENVEDPEEEGTRHFMVNVIQPQFNLHSEEANGRFLLAAASGRVLGRSFHSVLNVGYEMIEQALGTGSVQIPESEPQMTWKRMELSVMLEHVQAHVAPTDVDPGAGLQWLPKILRSSPEVKRTGALLERVFIPCTMYFRYTRHKGGTADLKVKPLKELTFNSPDIIARMTSRQFQVMLDVLTNLLFARLPKPRKSSLSYSAEADEDTEEEADEVVPDGVEEVELERINLEQIERGRKLLLDDIRRLSVCIHTSGELPQEKDGNLWMLTGGRTTLVQGLKKELGNTQKSRKAASASLRVALQKAAQIRLMEKEKNKSPSCAMRISLKINKVAWSMLQDGKSFAEAEINNMSYDFDRDYKDVGIAKFTTKSVVVRNCLPNAKSDMLLSAWNPPPEWGKNVMLRVDAKQGAPKDGNSSIELFQVEIYPLKIHLTETMYRMMWGYLFPEEEQDSQRRQEVWKVSTTAGAKRVKKGTTSHEPAVSSSHLTREPDASSKLSAPAASVITSGATQSYGSADSSQVSKPQDIKANAVWRSTPELRRTSSFDRTWEENVAESVANELVLHVHSSSISSSSGPLNSALEHPEELRNKSKDSKQIKSGRPSNEEKKVIKPTDEKRARPRKMTEFHIVKISQVELLVTYEGSRFAVSDLRLLMDTFHRVDFTGTWRRLFSRVKKHIIWGVLKSVTGMQIYRREENRLQVLEKFLIDLDPKLATFFEEQGKKFKDKVREPSGPGVPGGDLNCTDGDGVQAEKIDHAISWLKKPSDGAGDGFVTSMKGLFNSQRRKAKAFVLRTMRGEADNEFHGEWSDSDSEFSPFARQLSVTKAKKLIRRHTKKFRSQGQKGSASHQSDSLPSSPRETSPFESDSSSESPYEDFHE